MKSPFKFLDAYTKEDQHLFFGREDEIEELYQRVFKSNLLLVYGASGTGKTSLIQCGLSTRFSDENWFSVSIRRKDNINKSLINTVKTHGLTQISSDDLDNDSPEIVQRVEGLYLDHFKPVYLIIDQLEELFILGDQDEKDQFYDHIKDLVNSNIQCNIILIIREEYIAFLSEMEEVVPSLFDNRVRIEKMRKRKVVEVVEKSCQVIPDIEIKEKEVFLDEVIENLSEDELTVELTYLQVYLDKLYRNSEKVEGLRIFDMNLLRRTGKVHNVLTEFLEEQVQRLSNVDLGWKLLKVFITKDGTKKSASISNLKAALNKKNEEHSSKEITEVLQHFIDAKILTEMEQSPDIFEFTHDSLAIRTFEKLDAKERNLFDIQNLIEQQYAIYVNRKLLMSKENLLYVLPYLEDLNLNTDHNNFIKKSEKELTRKRKLRLAGIASIMVVLSALTIFSVLKAIDADQAKVIAEQEKRNAVSSLEAYKQEQNKRKTLQIDDLFEKAEAYIQANYRSEALKEINKIMKIDSTESINQRIEVFKEKYGL